MPSAARLTSALARRFVIAEALVVIGEDRYDVIRPRSAEDLIDEAEFERDERLPYWADIWPSSLIMAARLAEDEGGGRTLLELGCGLGIACIAAASVGYEVLATDYYADALRFTRANVARTLGQDVATRLVDWRAMPDDLGRFDRVVAADVLYERPYGALVAEVIAATLAPRGRAIIADPGRVAAPEFLERCKALGLKIETTEARPFDEGAIHQRITLYTLRRR